MVNDWGEIRSCLIIAEPTFPPGYFPSVGSTYLGELMMIGAYHTPTTAMFFNSIIIHTCSPYLFPMRLI